MKLITSNIKVITVDGLNCPPCILLTAIFLKFGGGKNQILNIFFYDLFTWSYVRLINFFYFKNEEGVFKDFSLW